MTALRLAALALVLTAAPAMAGQPYTPPAIAPGRTTEPPPDLRAEAADLLAAARARDAAAAGRFVSGRVRTISHSLDIGAPPAIAKLTTGEDPTGRIVALAGHTGGDWDIPQSVDGKPVDVSAFLIGMELDFIVQSLTDGSPWGLDPAAAGAVCTYAAPTIDRRAVRRAAAVLGIEASGLREPERTVSLVAAPTAGAAAVATIEPGRLYAVDYDAGEPTGWGALHLPKGGTGFLAADAKGDLPLAAPYVTGLCFGRGGDGHWQIVAQTATGL